MEAGYKYYNTKTGGIFTITHVNDFWVGGYYQDQKIFETSVSKMRNYINSGLLLRESKQLVSNLIEEYYGV